MKVIPGFPDPLRPSKLKNGHFWVFLDFSTNKKYANVKIEGSQIEGLSTSFNLIPKLCILDRAPLSYGPVNVPGSEKNFFKQIGAVSSRNDKSEKYLWVSLILMCSIR